MAMALLEAAVWKNLSSSRPCLRKERASGGMEVRLAGPQDAPAIARFNDRLTDGASLISCLLIRDCPAKLNIARTASPSSSACWSCRTAKKSGPACWIPQHDDHRRERAGDCWAHLPVSEGLVDNRYALTIFLLIKHAFADQPFQMCLGVGSLEETWARLLIKLGWSHAVYRFSSIPSGRRKCCAVSPICAAAAPMTLPLTC